MDCMPSWNIHTAHVERLLATEDPAALGIRDVNAFLLGNLAPDIYVGYMVPNITHRIDYRLTHIVGLNHIPEPRYDVFWEVYAKPTADERGRISDVALGAWTHLLADHVYNARFSLLLARLGLKASSEIRARKQADFDTFGRTLDISMVPEATPEVLAQCKRFPQYEIREQDVRAACDAMERIVADNAEHHVSEPVYDLVGADYFDVVPRELDAIMREALHDYASGDPDWGRIR